MSATKNNKRNSLPSLTLNIVNKRASIFEKEEIPPPGKRDWREWSPCGLVETSQRKMEERKEKVKKEMMRARLKRQADPYAEESSEGEEEEDAPDSKACGHASRSVNFGQVKKTLKQGQQVGECTQCRKGHRSDLDNEEPNPIVDNYIPVIWLCLYCGHQGCDRNTKEQHALLHYRRPHSDPHCLILNTQAWNVWCYDCDSEVHQTSSKKLHEVVEFIKRQKDMAPRRSSTTRPILNSSPFAAPESGAVTVAKGSLNSFDDNSKSAKNQRNAQASVLASLPKVKGLSNLGNTCFFNSVMQSLSQTHFLTQMLDVQCQSGQRVCLPGQAKPSELGMEGKANGEVKQENGRVKQQRKKEVENEDEDMELKPLDLYLPEGGGLTLSMSTLLKEMHSIGKNPILNPGYLFGQLHGMDASICKKSTQFQGYEQQDAHELLRCLLEAIRNEEILRAKRAILRAFALSEKTDPNTVSPRLKKMIKGYGRQATHTIIDQIFGGHLISTIFCEECHWSSQVFEPMMDLSLPINEEKGKPKKPTINDETVFDCFGRPTTATGNSSNTNANGLDHTMTHNGNSSLSKHQLKKQKKAEKKQRRGQKGHRKGGSLAPSCIQPNNEDDDNRSVKMKRRMTEKSHVGDQEDLARMEENQRTPAGGDRATQSQSTKRGESSRFKQLMAARKVERHKASDQGEDSDEDSEYDVEDDEEEDSLGGAHDENRTHGDKRTEENGSEKKDASKEETSEEEDSEETESESRGNESDANSSKKKGSSTETSDADIEDNTDSDRVRQQYRNTRQPSIVVEQSEIDTQGSNDNLAPNHRCLNPCNSSDQLNYNSASDTSERYYTPYEKDCNGLDTADDLENFQDPQVPVDQAHMDEMCLKVKELKIRRKSCSKESLLDTTQRFSQKRGSTETLHTFNERMEEEEDESIKKAKFLKKLKQEWIARSLTTLAPRYQCHSQECSVMSCLTNFTAPELLTGTNKITCENCTKLHNQLHPDDQKESVKSNASKQMLILSPPAVLTLHLKRFHHMGFNLTKVNRYVKFPLVLDLAPFTSSISLGLGNMSRGQSQVLYGLYGVVEHSGRLNSGHYVAYVRLRPLDPNHTNRQYLNLKPSSQFEIDQLVAEMAEKVEASSGTLTTDLKATPGSDNATNVQEFEEEIKAGRWFHVSDTYVAEVNIDRVLKSQAYLLFYERLV